MNIQIESRCAKEERVVSEHPEPTVAGITEETAHFPRLMVVVDIEPSFRLCVANRATSFMSCLQSTKLLHRQAEVMLELESQIAFRMSSVPCLSAANLLLSNRRIAGRRKLFATLLARSSSTVFAALMAVEKFWNFFNSTPVAANSV